MSEWHQAPSEAPQGQMKLARRDLFPLVGGAAVRGPADRMLARLAGGTTPAHVASCYSGLVDVLVIDEADAEDSRIDAPVRVVVTRTVMSSERGGLKVPSGK